MLEKLTKIKNIAIKEIEEAKTLNEIEEIRVKYLGKKSELTSLLKGLAALDPEERKNVGALTNELKCNLESEIELKKNLLENKVLDQRLQSEKIDISINKNSNPKGHKHILSIVLDDIKDIFKSMGYDCISGPEIEFTKFNFDALNTPPDHPSRDLQDTFYLTEDIILRTQTSPVQARTMLVQKPPIRVIMPGRVYRSDSVDATHSPMFHQVEGLVVDKGITMADLKGTLETFARKYFGEDTKIRLRPHHFPFTEPSAEMDVSCFVCGGSGCRVCKGEGWIELLGCGIVHPNVLKSGNIDSKIYTGFAFGMGLERIAMTKFGISDMRYLYENDIRFLSQF